MCRSVILGCLGFLLSTAPDVTLAASLFHENFSPPTDPAGLPAGWSIQPRPHARFVTSNREFQQVGASAPALRVTLDPRTLNYAVVTPSIPVEDASAEFTLSFALGIDQPDAPFLVQVIVRNERGEWRSQIPLLHLLGRVDKALQTYQASFQSPGPPERGSIQVHFGLPYARVFHAGSMILDDVELRLGRESGRLEMYASPTSVLRGEPIGLQFSSARSEAELSIYREGARRELVSGPSSLSGLREEPIPPDGSRDGAGWPTSTRFTAPEWPPGLYAIELNDGGQVAHETFVLRDLVPRARICVVLPTHTEEAYNDWGGHSFYSRVPIPTVSFNRPMTSPLQNYLGPIHLLRWLEREGYDYAVATDDDLDSPEGWIDRFDTLVIPGHSEYWTRRMRDRIESLLARGGAVLVLSGNTCWWQSRVEASDPTRLICYKYEAALDPMQKVNPALVTTHWDEAPLLDPPNRFLGVLWRTGGMVNWNSSWGCPCDFDWLSGHGGYQVWNTDHWLLSGLDLEEGETIGQEWAIVGFEVDGTPLDWSGARPRVAGEGGTPASFTVLGTAACWNQYASDHRGTAVMGVVEREGGLLFNAATTGWCFGLPHDAAVQTITRNALERALSLHPQPSIATQLSFVPNPVRDEGRFVVSLAPGNGGDPSFVLFDCAGRQVQSLPSQRLIAHRFEVLLRPRDFRLPSGVYWLHAPGLVPRRVVVVGR